MITTRTRRFVSTTLIAVLATASSLANAQSTVDTPAPLATPANAVVRVTTTLVGPLVADGKTPASLKIEALDASGARVAAGTVLHLEITQGTAYFENYAVPRVTPSAVASPTSVPSPVATASAYVPASLDTRTPAQSIDVVEPASGDLLVPIYPSTAAGTVRVHVSSGDVSEDVSFESTPSYRKPLVVGLVTAGVGAVPGPPGEADNVPDGFNSRLSRLALFGTGEVSKNATVSFAYDTANVLTQTAASGAGSFVDDPNQRPFATYGDSSVRYDDALSTDHLFALLQVGHSSLMWGEFMAKTGGTDTASLDGFTMLVNGLQGSTSLVNDRIHVRAFDATNNVAYGRLLYTPTGLASPGFTLKPLIVLGSDTITLIAYDRRTGAPISQRILTRNIDYTLDYVTGELYFINVPLQFDDNFNPQSVLIQYEYQGTGSSTAVGGRLEAALTPNHSINVGVGYSNYSSGAANDTTLDEDLSGVVHGGSWSIGHEAATGPVVGTTLAPLSLAATTSGDFWHAAYNQTVGQNSYRVLFSTTSSGYSNPFGGVATPGFSNYLASWKHAFSGDGGDFTLQYDAQYNAATATTSSYSQFEMLALLHQRVTKRVVVTAGLTAHGGNGVPTATDATGVSTPAGSAGVQGIGGVDYRFAPTADLNVQRVANFSGFNPNAPAETSAQLNVDFGSKGRAYVRQLWLDNAAIPFANSDLASTLTASAKSATTFGFERAVGANTTLDSEYVLENTGSGSDIYAATGIHERFVLTPFFKGDASFQHADSIGAGLGFDSYGLSLTTTDQSKVRGSLSVQDRTGNTPGFTAQVGVAGQISPAVSLLGSYADSQIGGYSSILGRVGVAFRPADSDRGATLLEFDDESGNLNAPNSLFAGAENVNSEILSISHTWDWSQRFQLQGRYAFKLDGEGYLPANSSLFGVRADERIGSRFDLGSELALLHSAVNSSLDTTTFAVEAGYRLGGATRLAAGYNFTGSPDPTLSNSTTHRGLYVTITSTVDRIFGWGAEHGGVTPR
jgi:hypothetical protein